MATQPLLEDFNNTTNDPIATQHWLFQCQTALVKFFFMSHLHLLSWIFNPLILVLPLGTTQSKSWKQTACQLFPSSVWWPFRYLKTIIPSLCLLFSRLHMPSFFNHSSFHITHSLSCPSMNVYQLINISSLKQPKAICSGVFKECRVHLTVVASSPCFTYSSILGDIMGDFDPNPVAFHHHWCTKMCHAASYRVMVGKPEGKQDFSSHGNCLQLSLQYLATKKI